MADLDAYFQRVGCLLTERSRPDRVNLKISCRNMTGRRRAYKKYKLYLVVRYGDELFGHAVEIVKCVSESK